MNNKIWYVIVIKFVLKLEGINGNKRKQGSGRACWKVIVDNEKQMCRWMRIEAL